MRDDMTPLNGPVLPRWFRRALVIGGALLMCSCRAIEPAAGQYDGGCPVGSPCQSDPCDGCYDGGCVTGGCPVCDPAHHLGPGDEYLCDGGDRPYPVGVLQDDSLIGLDQEDTVGHYTTRDGRTIVAPSTRTCIYAPRFGSIRQVVHPMGAEQRLFVDAVGDIFGAAEADRAQPASTSLQNVALHGRVGQLPPSLYRARQQAGETVRLQKAAETRGLVAPYLESQLMNLGVLVMDEGPKIANHALAAITWTGDQELQIVMSGQAASAVFDVKQPGLLYQTDEPNSPRLRIVKCASVDAAHPGDEVEFTLRFDNVGDAPMADVVIVDNLTTRLEYVEDSAQASVDADFSTERNGLGSLILRWAIDGELKPGEGGVLTFRTRVR